MFDVFPLFAAALRPVFVSDAPIMIFRGRFRYRFFRANWPIPIPIPIFFPLSNQQEIMKDSNTNKVFI